jgi:preprotein translocase subunit YajC
MDAIIPLLLLVLFVPLFLSFRKQRRQYSQLQQLQSSLVVGDEVLTTSGLQGTIIALGEDTVDLEIAPGVVTTWVRPAVRERLEEPAEAVEDEDETVSDETALDERARDEADRR